MGSERQKKSLAEFVADKTVKVQAANVKHNHSHPRGWEPGVTVAKGETVITEGPLPSKPEWADVLANLQLDPELYQVMEPVQVRAWDTPSGERLFYYKASVELRKARPETVDLAEIEALFKRKPSAPQLCVDRRALLVCLSDWQLGKALADNTPVLTTDGWTTHGKLRPGMFVYGPDGLPKKILGITGSSMQDCYLVTFDNGVEIEASGDHLWSGFRRYKDSAGRYSQRPLTLSTAEIASFGRSDREGKRSYVSRAFHVPLPSPVEFPEKVLPIDPYLLGAWLGDGVSKGNYLICHDSDRDHWLKEFGPESYVLPTAPRPGNSLVGVRGLTQLLSGNGLLHNKHVPEAYLNGDVSQRLSLLQGLMDTDGSISKDGIAEFSNTNWSLVEAVKSIAVSLGMKVSVKKSVGTLNGVAKKTYWRVQFRPDAANGVQHVFRMQRKLERMRPATNRSSHRYIQSIVPCGVRSAQCITVEGSLYLAGEDLVVTHNSEGGGSAATINRILGSLDALTARIKKGDYSTIVIASLGDMVESCTGHYAMQTFDVDLDRREQERAARRLLAEYVRRLAPYAPKVVVCGVPGNHGENRLNGKAYTRWSDNADVAMVEQVAEVVEGREGFEHVSFITPDRLELTLDVEGVVVGFAHGHMSRGGADKIPAWWHRQIVGRTPLGDAQILVTGHYHHFRAVEDYGRIWLQCPSQDGGSYWFQAVSGQHAASGMLVAEVGEMFGPRGIGGISLV